MKLDNIFSSTIRKYHIDGKDSLYWADETYEKYQFQSPSPFRQLQKTVPEHVTKPYEEICSQLLKDLNILDTHLALITQFTLSVFQKGEQSNRERTLPSHYTLTHHITGTESDIFYHPARDFLQIVNPLLDEWSSATSLYINEGDVTIHPSYLEYRTPPVKQIKKTITCFIDIVENPNLIT